MTPVPRPNVEISTQTPRGIHAAWLNEQLWLFGKKKCQKNSRENDRFSPFWSTIGTVLVHVDCIGELAARRSRGSGIFFVSVTYRTGKIKSEDHPEAQDQ